LTRTWCTEYQIYLIKWPMVGILFGLIELVVSGQQNPNPTERTILIPGRPISLPGAPRSKGTPARRRSG
jgi:hypothetical protein